MVISLEHQLFENVSLAGMRAMVDGKLQGGLADADNFPDFARHMREGKPADSSVVDFSATPPFLDGGYIYGGMLLHHYGHLMTECLHRLWMADMPAYSGWPVLFVVDKQAFKLHQVLEDALAHFGITKYRLVDADTIVERLAIGEAGKQFRRAPEAAYTSWLESRVPTARYRREDMPTKLCVMRSHLWSGRLVGEGLIEEWLQEEGYHIFRPEDCSLQEQIVHYASAEKIVFSEGSAIHTLDIMAPIGADVALLQRRPLSTIAETSLAPKASVYTVKDAVRLLHPSADQPNRLSNALSFINLADVATFLTEYGFLEENHSEHRFGARAYSGDLSAYNKHYAKGQQALSPAQSLEAGLEAMFMEHSAQFNRLTEARYKLFLSKAYHALSVGAYGQAETFAERALQQMPGNEKSIALIEEARSRAKSTTTPLGRLWDRVRRMWLHLRIAARLPNTEPPR